MNVPFECIEASELDHPPEAKRWIWDGFLHPGQITLFTSMWKSGKTTLLSHLLAQRKAGGTLAGRAVSAGVNVVVTEEPRALWHERHARLGFGPRDSFICRPFAAVPTQAQWQELIRFVGSRGADLVIFDPLARCLPAGAENNPQLLLEAVAPLQSLLQQNLAVLLVHHPRRAGGSYGTLARGTGMLPSSVDILIEMYRICPNDGKDRRRRLVGFSRDAATPASLVIELAEDGRSYTLTDDVPNDDFVQSWVPLRMVLEGADKELTRQQIRSAWPNSFPAPARNTLWTWLNLAMQRGIIQRSGLGTRMDPFRYCLVGQQASWQAKTAEPSATPNLDAWLEDWQKQYPAPPEWDQEDEPFDDEEEDAK